MCYVYMVYIYIYIERERERNQITRHRNDIKDYSNVEKRPTQNGPRGAPTAGRSTRAWSSSRGTRRAPVLLL